MKRIVCIITTLVMMVGLFASYSSMVDAAEATEFFFDYTDGYTPSDVGKPYTNTNTKASYDASQKAIKITTAGKRAGEAS